MSLIKHSVGWMGRWTLYINVNISFSFLKNSKANNLFTFCRITSYLFWGERFDILISGNCERYKLLVVTNIVGWISFLPVHAFPLPDWKKMKMMCSLNIWHTPQWLFLTASLTKHLTRSPDLDLVNYTRGYTSQSFKNGLSDHIRSFQLIQSSCSTNQH